LKNALTSDKGTKKPEEKRGLKSYVKKVTRKNVVADLFGDRINKVISDQYGVNAEPGDKVWLAKFSEALRKVMQDLSCEEKALVQEKIDEWSKTGLPPHLQDKYVIRFSK